MLVLIFPTTIYIYIYIHIGIYVKYELFLSDFNKNLNFLESFFAKYSNIKFHENPSSESRFFFFHADVRTDMTKLIVAFRNFFKAP